MLHRRLALCVFILSVLHEVSSGTVEEDEDEFYSCSVSKSFMGKVEKIVADKIEKFERVNEEREEDQQTEVKQLNERIAAIENVLFSTMDDCPSEGSSGEYVLHDLSFPPGGIKVYCDTETDGGGWVVFQRRENGKVNFNRDWNDYKNGFGLLSGDFWLGLQPLSQIIKTGEYELRIELKDWDRRKVWAGYRSFSICDEDDFFTLDVSGYEGTAGDSLTQHDGAPFSTKNLDNDAYDNGNCASELKGGWWFKNCSVSNLNGKYYKGGEYTLETDDSKLDGVTWYYWKNTELYSMKMTEMKIRRK